MAKIYKFPELKDEPKKEMNHELDIARELMNKIVITLSEYRYDPASNMQMIKDLGLIYHMLYAMMLRTSNDHHQMHEMMDEIMKELEKQRGSD